MLPSHLTFTVDWSKTAVHPASHNVPIESNASGFSPGTMCALLAGCGMVGKLS